jgi:hypothetical protein
MDGKQTHIEKWFSVSVPKNPPPPSGIQVGDDRMQPESQVAPVQPVIPLRPCPLADHDIKFVRWVASANVSLRSATDDDLRDWIEGFAGNITEMISSHIEDQTKFMCGNVEPASVSESARILKEILTKVEAQNKSMDRKGLRRKMLAYSNWLEESTRYALRGKRVSLITDGVKWADRTLYVVVAFLPDRLFFLEFLHFEKADHQTIATKIGEVVKKLEQGNTTVDAICSDNAANLVCAFTPNMMKETLSASVGHKIIHVRCGVHTVHLIFDDLAKGSEKFRNFKEFMREILKWLRSKPVQNALIENAVGRFVPGKIPRIQEIKWSTYTKGATWLNGNKRLIQALLKMDKLSPPYTEWPEDYDDFLHVIFPIDHFIRETEESFTTLPEMYDLLLTLFQDLREKKNPRNPDVRMAIELVKKRFRETADGTLALLGYVFTYKGFQWFKGKTRLLRETDVLGDRDTRAQRQRKNEKTVEMINEMRKKLQETAVALFGKGLNLGFAFDDYLDGCGPSDDQDLQKWWDYHRWTSFQRRGEMGEEIRVSRLLFGNIAKVIIDLPASEAVCERVFSEFHAAFTDQRESASDELVQAQMRVKMERRWNGWRPGRSWPARRTRN